MSWKFPGLIALMLVPLNGLAVDFNRDIRPILSDNCFQCHGPDSASRKADLRLDREEDAIADRDGERVIAPGDPGASLLLARVLTTDPDEVMPPPKSHKSVSAEEAELLRQWIAEGAEWQEHWAFLPPVKAEPEADPTGWSRNAIDRFVRSRLELEQFTPSAEADRRTLIRRVTLDLTGLPPTPEEIDTFLEDERPDAWERVVDRLLDSPRYGEHRARFWLDAARYADTHGLHLDNYREMWPYRDWVIGAFNDNKPFDRFTVEQLAGDLLPEPSPEQRIATGFNRCNVTTSEGGAIAEEFLVRYAVDRVNTTSTVWMGLTAECSQCHDHKFDPLSQREYYQLFAFFNQTTQAGMDGNRPDTPPVIRLYPDDATREAEASLQSRVKEVDEALKKIREGSAEPLQAWLAEGATGTRKSLRTRSGEQEPVQQEISSEKPFTLVLRVKAPPEPVRQVLFEQLDPQGRGLQVTLDTENEGVELALIGGEKVGELRVQQIKRVQPGSTNDIVLLYDGSGDPRGIVAWIGAREMSRDRFPYLEVDRLKGDFTTQAPLKLLAKPEVLERMELHGRLLNEEEIQAVITEPKVPAVVALEAEKRNKDQVALLTDHFLQTAHENYQKLLEQRSSLKRDLQILQRRIPVTHVMEDKPGEPMAHVLQRGEYDKPGEVVKPGVPAALPPLPPDAPLNRLSLAQWLVRPDHPLTARVTVNRLWQQFFGAGLVATPGDFGLQGELPSHPELLDWLAVEFVEHGWDVKHLIREIVTSATYRQSSRMTSEHLARDPKNRLLAHGPRFRLDAETLRDQALFTSGLLVEKQGGPPVRPYQPDGLWEAVGYENSNTVKFYRHYGENLYRRSIYTFLKRTSPPPNMSAFDAPDRESCTVRRERTNTPLQALVLMNDVQFVEAARNLATRVSGEADPLEAMTLRVLGRAFDDHERRIANDSLSAFRQYYVQNPNDARALLQEGDSPVSEKADPVELASLTMLASQILNLDEALSRN